MIFDGLRRTLCYAKKKKRGERERAENTKRQWHEQRNRNREKDTERNEEKQREKWTENENRMNNEDWFISIQPKKKTNLSFETCRNSLPQGHRSVRCLYNWTIVYHQRCELIHILQLDSNNLWQSFTFEIVHFRHESSDNLTKHHLGWDNSTMKPKAKTGRQTKRKTIWRRINSVTSNLDSLL